MFALYNRGCKIPVKKMEKNKLRLLVVEDEKKLCDMIAYVQGMPEVQYRSVHDRRGSEDVLLSWSERMEQ